MPIQRRVPKFGFTSRQSLVSAEIRLQELNYVDSDVIDIFSLHAADLIDSSVKQVKVFLSGSIDKPVTIRGIRVSKGAKAAIEAAGGNVE